VIAVIVVRRTTIHRLHLRHQLHPHRQKECKISLKVMATPLTAVTSPGSDTGVAGAGRALNSMASPYILPKGVICGLDM